MTNAYAIRLRSKGFRAIEAILATMVGVIAVYITFQATRQAVQAVYNKWVLANQDVKILGDESIVVSSA